MAALPTYSHAQLARMSDAELNELAELVRAHRAEIDTARDALIAETQALADALADVLRMRQRV